MCTPANSSSNDPVMERKYVFKTSYKCKKVSNFLVFLNLWNLCDCKFQIHISSKMKFLFNKALPCAAAFYVVVSIRQKKEKKEQET